MNTEKKLSEMSRIELMQVINDLLGEHRDTLKDLIETKKELSNAYNFIIAAKEILDLVDYCNLCDKYLDS